MYVREKCEIGPSGGKEHVLRVSGINVYLESGNLAFNVVIIVFYTISKWEWMGREDREAVHPPRAN